MKIVITILALLFSQANPSLAWDFSGRGVTKKFEKCLDTLWPRSIDQDYVERVLANPRPVEEVPPNLNAKEAIAWISRRDDDFGVRPVWDGQRYVPFRYFHRERIKVVAKCHQILDIKNPKRIRGSYGEWFWDPNHKYWKTWNGRD